ncbi:GAF domain-containing sensor histidine kinase [Leptolyngbya cf. ectocarpi LEGE 11479]|uniref:histidine kinase n=1 Tax=Leptolyngbya cf. ectocarpi LEGE 11479 TaxID=1828722 RepID=A0A928ZXX5_LEPEC|nr:ATP-binding protein [Leptolyngbya ectocarpi]MBE9069463.1 GAF domain-containing sensor histidine kinase [Leptolyngbya cf. ectocarpi LEGE 11479]
MSASAELVDMCRAHLDLLRGAFGEVSSIVYLTLGVDADSAPILVPIAQVPESSEFNDFLNPMGKQGALPASKMPLDALSRGELAGVEPLNPDIGAERLVLPLMHQEIVMGVLVTLRSDRPWQASEQKYLQTVSASLAAGCFLDRQNQWLRQRLNTKQTLQGEQSEIFHNLLHQFRNPLTAIGTFGKLMLRRLSQDDPNYRLADGIVRESQHLKDLVTDFDAAVEIGDTDMAQEVSPPLLPDGTNPDHKPLLPALGRALTLTPQSLGDVLQPLIMVTVAAADERHRQFWHSPIKQFSKTLVIIDAQALQEVIANLLDNAFKYAPPQTWVWLLGGVSKGNYVGIVIGDNGPGIPPEDQVHLFERHYRGIQTQGTITGTGLGLAIAKNLMTQMGGSIDLISPVWPTNWGMKWDQEWGEKEKNVLPPWLPTPLHQYLLPGDQGTAFIVWLPTMAAQTSLSS